jgi:hypothetical protein
MINHFPEVEFAINKTANAVTATIDFNTNVYTKSLEYFNEITDKMFYAWTSKAAESLNTVSDHAKENITETTTKIVALLGGGK